MNEHHTLTEDDMKTAHAASWRRYGYPPCREKLSVQLDTHPSYARDDELIPFVMLRSIPERFHKAFCELATGSTCPSIEGLKHTFYTHDVDRWLRSIGVEATFVMPS